MTKIDFIEKTNIASCSIHDRLMLVIYFIVSKESVEPSFKYILKKYVDFGFSSPNSTRFRKILSKSKKVIRGKVDNTYRLSIITYQELKLEYPFKLVSSEAKSNNYSILPPELYMNTRGFIKSISNQINSSYENCIFDGCSVLMRRLLEMLLVISYRKHGIDNFIIDPSNNSLKSLSYIISYTTSNKIFNLSKLSYSTIDIFRELGNLSAHRIEYNCRKSEIDKVKLNYRVLIEELLYKSTLLK